MKLVVTDAGNANQVYTWRSYQKMVDGKIVPFNDDGATSVLVRRDLKTNHFSAETGSAHYPLVGAMVGGCRSWKGAERTLQIALNNVEKCSQHEECTVDGCYTCCTCREELLVIEDDGSLSRPGDL